MQVNIYACGGTGVNLANDYLDMLTGGRWPAKVKKILVDLSDSNMHDDTHPRYLVDGIRGSGKNRAEALRVASPHIEKLLQEHPPADANFIIYGGAGGSGSVLGPLIAAEISRRGEVGISFLIASTASGKEADNSYKTMLTLYGLAKRHGITIPIVPYMNMTDPDGPFTHGTGPRSKVDAAVDNDIHAMSLLLSEQHHELDRTDVVNFFHPERVTKVPPQVIEYAVLRDDLAESLEGRTIATASLLHNEDDQIPALGQPYDCTGYFRKGDDEMPMARTYVATAHYLPIYTELLKSKADAAQTVEDQLAAKPTYVGEVQADDDGFVI